MKYFNFFIIYNIMNNFNFNQAKNKQYHKEIDSYKIGKFILDNNIFKPIIYL